MKTLILVLAALVLAAGCGSDDSAEPSGEPAYSGIVKQVDGDSVLVVADGDACGIWTRRGEGVDTDVWSSLETDQEVDLWIPGPIAESCPMQATAEAVVITAPA